jgi:hypothetical protein
MAVRDGALAIAPPLLRRSKVPARRTVGSATLSPFVDAADDLTNGAGRSRERHARGLPLQRRAGYAFAMSSELTAKLELRRFMWVQDFAARLAELGAPASFEAMLALGRERFRSSAERDAARAAESVWSEWPTEH